MLQQNVCLLVSFSLGFHVWQVQRDNLNSTLQKSAPVVGVAEKRSDLRDLRQTPHTTVTPCGHSLNGIIQFNTVLFSVTRINMGTDVTEGHFPHADT